MKYEKAKVPWRFADELENFFGAVLAPALKEQLTKRLTAWLEEHNEVELTWVKDSLEEIRDHAINRLADIDARSSQVPRKD